MTPELLPCPFCGHPALLSNHALFNYDTRETAWIVECTNFGECEAELTGFASADAAISKWNGRYNNIIPTAKAGGFPKGSGK